MSERALPYYLPQFDQFALPTYPTLINGQEQLLMEPGEKMSLYAPGSVGAGMREHLGGIVDSFLPFVMHEHIATSYDPTVEVQNRRYLDKILGPLFLVRSIKGGSLHDVSIEVVAPEDVTKTMLRSLIPSAKVKGYDAVRDPDRPRVFFVIRGLVRVRAYSSTPVAGVAALFRNNENHSNQMSPYFYSAPISGPDTAKWHNRPRVPKKLNPGEESN